MRRVWAITAVSAALSVGGCGTAKNLTNWDGEGREAYGGLTRDLHSLAPSSSSNEAKRDTSSPFFGRPTGLGGLAVGTCALLVCVGVVGGEFVLSAVADTATLPLVRLLNHFDESGKTPEQAGNSPAPDTPTDRCDVPVTPSAVDHSTPAEPTATPGPSPDRLPPLPPLSQSTPPPG